MVFESGDFDANLAAAAGDDLILLAQLRAGFAESLTAHVDLLRRARCDANWRTAAARLHALGTGFHAAELAHLAQAALDGAPGEPGVLRQLSAMAGRVAAIAAEDHAPLGTGVAKP